MSIDNEKKVIFRIKYICHHLYKFLNSEIYLRIHMYTCEIIASRVTGI